MGIMYLFKKGFTVIISRLYFNSNKNVIPPLESTKTAKKGQWLRSN